MQASDDNFKLRQLPGIAALLDDSACGLGRFPGMARKHRLLSPVNGRPTEY
jgi:hypothetical protein